MILVTIDKFDPNPIPINISKLKPCKFVKDHTFQPLLAKINYLLLKEPVEIDQSGNMFTKNQLK
jgi:hypothetical protein